MKFAEVFDVSIDYLLVEDAPHRPSRLDDTGLLERLQDIHTLSEEDRSSLLLILDALLAKHKMKKPGTESQVLGNRQSWEDFTWLQNTTISAS